MSKQKKVFRSVVQILSGRRIYSSANIDKKRVYRLSLPTNYANQRKGLTKYEITKLTGEIQVLQQALSRTWPSVRVDFHIGCCAYLNVRVNNSDLVG